MQSQARVKALEEDPSVFEYDSVYDKMQEKKKTAVQKLATKDRQVCMWLPLSISLAYLVSVL